MAYGKLKVDTLTYDNAGSDVDVDISTIPSGAAIAAKADIASPALTGTPTAPTAAQGTNTTQLATTAYVKAEITADLAAGNYLDNADIGVSVQAYDADNAVTDATQTFTAGQRGEVTTVTSSSGVLNIDFNASNNFYIELTENLSSITVSNATAGQSGSIFIAQPASGGPYTVGGWAAAFLFSGGTAPTITATNSKTDRVDYVIRTASEIQVVWTGNY